jgi:sigma-E factor negative regulatory protein RseC
MALLSPVGNPDVLESPALVVGLDEGLALVEADYGGGCGSGMCVKGGCGTAVLGRLFSNNPRGPLRVDNPIQARPGERVMIGVGDGMLLRAAATAYLLPLAGFVTGALVGRVSLAGGDAGAVLGALGGLAVGWVLARASGASMTRSARPVILRRI